MINLILPLAAVFLTASPGAHGQAAIGVTREQAIAAASAYIGFTDQQGLSVAADQVTPQNDETPYLHSLINGHQVWVVRFGGLSPTVMGGNRRWTTTGITGLNAMIDASSGRLLRIWSTEGLARPDIPRPASEKEPMMTPFKGLPEDPPAVGLLEALESCSAWNLSVGRLEAVYVRQDVTTFVEVDGKRVLGDVERPVWNIYVWANTPLHIFGPHDNKAESPVWSLRQVVDAETAQLGELSSAVW